VAAWRALLPTWDVVGDAHIPRAALQPYVEDESFNAELTVVIALLLFTAFAVAVWWWFPHEDAVDACATVVCATAVAFSVAHLMKYATLEPRPDFMARCVPRGVLGVDAGGAAHVILVPRGDGTHIRDVCTGDHDRIIDGMLNFPSAHATTFAALAVSILLVAFELLGGEGSASASCAASLWTIASSAIAMAIAIGSSRVADHRHDWWAVGCGFALGTFIASCVYAAVYFHRSSSMRD